MNVALWTAQIALAAVFAGSGAAKLTMCRERLLATGQTGVAMFPMPVVRFTASMELLAVLGVILPWLTGVARLLTPIAALGLCAVMVGALSAHARLHEPRNVAANILIVGLALLVAVGRVAELL